MPSASFREGPPYFVCRLTLGQQHSSPRSHREAIVKNVTQLLVAEVNAQSMPAIWQGLWGSRDSSGDLIYSSLFWRCSPLSSDELVARSFGAPSGQALGLDTLQAINGLFCPRRTRGCVIPRLAGAARRSTRNTRDATGNTLNRPLLRAFIERPDRVLINP